MVAPEANATTFPSAVTEGENEKLSASAPSVATLTRCVVPALRSWTNTSVVPLVSPSTRSGASERNTTIEPSPEIFGWTDPLPPPTPATSPAGFLLTRSSAPVSSEATKMSFASFVSSSARLPAPEAKATSVPSAEMLGANENESASAPSGVTETRTVVASVRSWTNTSVVPLVSLSTRSVAVESKATRSPSAEIDGFRPGADASSPSEATDTRTVVLVSRSCTKTSCVPLVSPSTRFDAVETKAIAEPSSLITGPRLGPLAAVPSGAWLTRKVMPVTVSRTKMSLTLLVSPGTRLVAFDSKAINRPSPDAVGTTLRSSAWPPVESIETRPPAGTV